MEKVKKLIDVAFKQSLEILCQRFEMNPDQIHLLIEFIGTQIRMTAFRDEEKLSMIPISDLMGSKMIAARLSADEIKRFLKSLYALMSEDIDEKGVSQIKFVIYYCKGRRKPCIGLYNTGKIRNPLPVSDVMKFLKIGTEQTN